MKAVELSITAKGCPKINLQVRNTNQAVIAFYNAIGYDNDNVVSLGKRQLMLPLNWFGIPHFTITV